MSPDTLPAGLQLNPGTGVISGTPAQGTAGASTFTLIAGNGVSPDATLAVQIVIAPAAV